ncbi:YolD-like family protein [Psychrobacillus sp. NPDC096426]|uniref:YolD-like family protein n=1 Tax=Psychrobacillus sp. NPDC096426 TaxID=3364491 RepID=UPI0038001AA0
MMLELFFDEVANSSKYGLDPRRNIKWGTSMMLPEHVKMLREYYSEQKKAPRPVLSSFDLDILQENIQLAMKRDVDVKIMTWEDGLIESHIGKITWIDLQKRMIEIEDVYKAFVLQFDIIVDVTIIE